MRPVIDEVSDDLFVSGIEAADCLRPANRSRNLPTANHPLAPQ